MQTEDCRLCASKTIELSLEKTYYICQNCKGIQISGKHFLLPEEEKHRYSLHNNNIKEKGYRDFLSQLLNPVVERIPENAQGLDYGSGPQPSLSVLFQEQGINVNDFDPYFANNKVALTRDYDFIVCSETAEHFSNPSMEFEKINELLKPEGLLGLMTLTFQSKITDFDSWFYRADPTHIFFYQLETLEFLAKKMNWQLEIISSRVFIFRKGA